MAEFIETVDRSTDLTVVTVHGQVTVDDIVEATEAYYQGIPTRSLIFDFQHADVSDINAEHLRKIARTSKHVAHSRQNGRTAIVVATDAAFGMGRMLETFMEFENLPIAFNIFKDMDRAMQWVLSSEPGEN